MKIIVTHLSPDLDALASSWLLKRFLTGWTEAEITYVPAGETYKNQPPELWDQYKTKAKEELCKLAQANSLNNWEFNEYLHGQLGTPMGIPYQSWNMAMYIHAYNAVKDKGGI